MSALFVCVACEGEGRRIEEYPHLCSCCRGTGSMTVERMKAAWSHAIASARNNVAEAREYYGEPEYASAFDDCLAWAFGRHVLARTLRKAIDHGCAKAVEAQILPPFGSSIEEAVEAFEPMELTASYDASSRSADRKVA